MTHTGGAIVDVFGIPVHIVSALLLAAGLLVLISLALVARAVHGDPPAPDIDALRAAARERAEHAAAAQVRAGQAAAAAAQYRAWASAAVAARDVAWQMQEDAHAAYQQARQLAAVAHRDVPVPQPDRTVSRAALSAYHRGDISVDELHQVWVREEGLDPRQAEREQEVQRAGAAERAARHRFDGAAAESRRAQEAARVAEVAAQALAEEAAFAAGEAHDTLLAVEMHLPRRRRSRS